VLAPFIQIWPLLTTNFPLEIVIRPSGLSGLAEAAAMEYPPSIEVAITAIA
jgi:hypothetical protein